MSASDFDHYILPTLPKVVDRDAIVLKVVLKKMPDWSAQSHDEAAVSVLGVIKGRFSGRSVSLFLRPKSSCDAVGVIGRPGYVVLRRDAYGWKVIAYHVVNGRTAG